MSTVLEQINSIKEIVAEYYDNYAESLIAQPFNEEQRNHVIQIGTSILCTKWQVGYEGGGFAQAVVNNDLMRAVSNADSTNGKALRFYVSLMYNTAYPSNI